MTRPVAIALLTLACTPSLQADILMRLPSLPAGNSTLPGYAGWIPIDSIGFSIDRDPPPSGESGGVEDINIGIGRINLFTITKPTDAVSTRLFQFAINGNSIGTAEFRIVDAAHGCAVPTTAWKLDRAFVSSYSTSSAGDEPVESVSFYFSKIAYGVVEDGAIAANGWNRTTALQWTDHGLQTALQNELNAAQCIPGDFTLDGRVDGADFLRWQRGLGSTTFSSTDLSAWRTHFGQSMPVTAAAIPEPATTVLMIAAAFTLCGLSVRRQRGASSLPRRSRRPHSVPGQ